MKKGFTLVELLAVIVILGLLSLLIVPKVINTLKDSEEKTNMASAKGLLKAAEYRYQDNDMKGISENITIDYTNNINTDKLDFNGTKPEKGKINISSNGNISMAVKIGDNCYAKSFNSKDIQIKEFDAETCNMPESLATDSWKMIREAIRTKNTDVYNIGDTKNVTINNKTYTVRLVNKTYDDCDTKENGFSQTACGFVFEFVEYIGTNVMNSTSTNIGSFPATSAYNYLKSGIYESFPSDLKNVIADTYIVYGHGSTQEENNFSTTEKIYLPSVKELYGNNCYGLTNICNGDTANDYTKELEYYKYNDNKEDRKKYGVDSNTAQNLWLRSPSKSNTNSFIYVSTSGSPGTAWPQQSYGLAPLFRIE